MGFVEPGAIDRVHLAEVDLEPGRGLVAIEGPAGRIELKKFMKRLKESGYQTFNTKKGGRIVEVENW